MDKQIAKLRSLCQLDIDAVGTYDAAIARVDVPLLKEKLGEFRGDHLRHVEALNAAISRLGGEPVSFKADMKGALLKGFTAVTSMMGNEAALTAMIGNEELTNRTYQAARELEWGPDERVLIERHYADEQRHLAWIKMAAKERPWARPDSATHP